MPNRDIKHEMKIDGMWFTKMKAGEKTLELRLYDEKRQTIRPGDIISFRKFPGLEEALTMEVTGVMRYAGFDDLIEDVPADWLGHPDKAYVRNCMHTIYTPEEEKEYGVVGIRLKKAPTK